MSNTVTKLDLIAGALSESIAANIVKADEAMKTLELMNITPEEYREASETLARYTYANTFLARVLNVIATDDIKKTENIMRFHSHQLLKKGSIGENDGISEAQLDVAIKLKSLIERFFEN